MSAQLGPELHLLDVQYTKEASCTRAYLYYRSLCFSWACLHYRGLCFILDVSVKQGLELHMSGPQEPLSVSL
jgi:hypothetical protein